MKYTAKCGEVTQEQLAEFEGTGYSKNFIRLLVGRGINTKEAAKKFFDFDCNNLHNPYLLKGMPEAISRIKTAIAKKESVLIVGDYDCDGICATAIMYKFLLSKKVKTSYFLPEREADGYGLNNELIAALNGKFKPNLLITVDCGISCYKQVEFAKSLGIDCIITDHHAIPDIAPDCICVDPKFKEQRYPFDDLCGAGVALKVVQAMDGIYEAKKYFDLAAIATVADIVSLQDENRVIVHNGLKMLNDNTLPGITELIKSCNIRGKIKSSDIGFKLGPKINASGRMGNAKRGLDIMLEKDPERIASIIKSLTLLNTRRQKLCTTIYDDAAALIEEKNLNNDDIIIVAKPEWESGVLGIVSARITDKYGKPSIVLGGTGEVYKGSGRSIGGINMVETVSKAADLLISFGGHAMAAGLSVSAANYEQFVTAMKKEVAKIDFAKLNTDRYYDFEVDINTFDDKFLKEVERLEPTGCGNQTPVFMSTIRRTCASALANFKEHTRFNEGQLKFIFFGGAVFNDILSADCEKSIIFELQNDNNPLYKSKGIKAIVKCVVPFAVNDDEKALVLERYLCGELAVTPDDSVVQIIYDLSVDRDIFISYYRALEKCNRISAATLIDLYYKVAFPQKSIFQFVFCFSVFRQLSIMEMKNNRLIIDKSKSTNLGDSAVYNLVVKQKSGGKSALNI
jgi:single-stranded-DNA-specific exonuclease